MGEVYRARDTRLDRTVAVKILPSHLADNPEARQRFEREARTISSLNHPNICVLHDVGEESGTSYLVMEFVQGETLDARLQKGPMPLKQALECGVQICDALEKAHRAGIVHRDLKPGNIMLTATGAKLLDFGLAKPVALFGAKPISSQGSLTPSTPTMSLSALGTGPTKLTQQGSIVGTFQYMAPETLQGQEADARSDIFSFGCVLYEMVTGRRAFEGKSQLSVASAILEREPDPVSKLLPMAPAALDHVVNDCLAKDPEARWQNAADIARQLRWIANAGPANAAASEAEKRNPWPERMVWGAVAGALLGTLLWLSLRRQEPGRALHSFLPPPAEANFDFTGDFSGPPVLNAEGTAVAYCAHTQKDRNAIWVQSLSELGARKLEGTEGASFPFWSADGKYIGYFAEGHLKKVPASGGPVTVLADAPNPRGGTWNRDNVIVFEPDYRDTLWRINANGGNAERLTKFEGGKHTTHRWPQFLPDGRHFLFFATSHSGTSEQGIYMGDLTDGSFHHLIDADAGAEYASGYLLYHIQSQLLAQKFNPRTGTLSGDPLTVATAVEYDLGTWHATFSTSRNGLLIYEPGSKTLGTDLVWMDRTGKELGKVSERGFYKGAGRFSPDGKHLAVAMGDPQADIWVLDLANGARTRLTFGGATHLEPSWSADGRRIVFQTQNGTTVMTGTSLRSRLASGGGQEEVLLDTSPKLQVSLLTPQLSPDGQYLIHKEQDGPSGSIWALPLTGDKKLFPVVQAATPQTRIVQFRLSPNGRWLAYSSTESGREEVYVTHFPSGQGRWQVSQNGGTYPSWSADGKEILFISTELTLQVAAVNTKSQEFEVEAPHALFKASYTNPVGNPYDISPDGKRLVFSSYSAGAPTPIVVVTNWTSDLKK